MSGENPAITDEVSWTTYSAWATKIAKSDLILCISLSELKHARNCSTSKEI